MKAKKLFLAAAVLATALTFTLSCTGKKPAAYPEGAYVEAGGGFLIVPPESCEAVDDPEDRFKVFMAYEEGAFGATANFEISPRSNLNLDGFAAFLMEDAKTTHNANILGQQDFKTAKGLKGKKITLTFEQAGKEFRMSYYVFPHEKGYYMTITAGGLASSGNKYDAAIDKSMKTFEWIEVSRDTEQLSGAYIEKRGGFQINPPGAWKTIENPKSEYKILIPAGEFDIGASINFATQESDVSLDEFLSEALGRLQTALAQQNFQIHSQEDFTTSKGLKGKKTVATMAAGEHQIRFAYYLFPSEAGKYIFATGSVPSLDEKFNALFDEAMKTFEWIE
jgi:hypothetical protein